MSLPLFYVRLYFPFSSVHKPLSLSASKSAFSSGLPFTRNPPPPDYPQPFIPFRNSKSKEAPQLKALLPKPPSASDFLLGETPPLCSCLPNLCTSCRGRSAKYFLLYTIKLFFISNICHPLLLYSSILFELTLPEAINEVTIHPSIHLPVRLYCTSPVYNTVR